MLPFHCAVYCLSVHWSSFLCDAKLYSSFVKLPLGLGLASSKTYKTGPLMSRSSCRVVPFSNPFAFSTVLCLGAVNEVASLLLAWPIAKEEKKRHPNQYQVY